MNDSVKKRDRGRSCLVLLLILVLGMSLNACAGLPGRLLERLSKETTVEESCESASEQTTGTSAEVVSEETFADEMPTESSSAPQEILKPGDSKGIMWEVTSPDGSGKLYLLGSIHIALEETSYFHPAVIEAFYASGALVVECDVVAFESDFAAITAVAAKLMYTDGTTLRDHMAEETYSLLKAYVEENDVGYPMLFLDYMTVYAVLDILQLGLYMDYGFLPEYGVDSTLLHAAKAANMPVIEVESVAFQMDMLTSFSDELQELLMIDFLENHESVLESIEEMLEMWRAGDIAGFEAYLDEDEEVETDVTPEAEALIEEYNRKMLDDRNLGMTDKAIELLESGETYFYVVGAAHMFGDTGIVPDLIAAGYSVVPMEYE